VEPREIVVFGCPVIMKHQERDQEQEQEQDYEPEMLLKIEEVHR
jgi:hypothetical protein